MLSLKIKNVYTNFLFRKIKIKIIDGADASNNNIDEENNAANTANGASKDGVGNNNINEKNNTAGAFSVVSAIGAADITCAASAADATSTSLDATSAADTAISAPGTTSTIDATASTAGAIDAADAICATDATFDATSIASPVGVHKMGKPGAGNSQDISNNDSKVYYF